MTAKGNGPLGAPLMPPVETPQLIWEVLDLNGDSDPDFELFAERSGGLEPFGTEVYRVVFVLRGVRDSKSLRATNTRIPFNPTELVSSSRKIFDGGGGGNWIPLGTFIQQRVPGAEWTYQEASLGPFTPSLEITNLLIGCKFSADDGVHYGWIHFARADQHYLTQYDVVETDWNPLPGEPIAAGLPPVIPLTSELTAEGIRLHWPAALTQWILEESDSLAPDAHWSPVPEVRSGEALVPTPGSLRYFRLRRP